MKKSKYKYHFLLLFICLIGVGATAQQTNEEKTFLNNQISQLNLNKETSLLENQNPVSNYFQAQDNFVKLNQVGNNNGVELKINLNDAQNVSQFGNNNSYNYINYYNKSESNFNILQQGNSNSLQIYGENSLMKKLSVVQKTNFKTIIITNY